MRDKCKVRLDVVEARLRRRWHLRRIDAVRHAMDVATPDARVGVLERARRVAGRVSVADGWLRNVALRAGVVRLFEV